MFYQNMPLYLKLVNILKCEYVIVHNMPKEYKYSLGQDIIDRTWRLIDLFMAAQSKNSIKQKGDKAEIIRSIDLDFEGLKLCIRFLTELKLVSLGQATQLSSDVLEIGKMIGSWLKNV